jgi:hypothetical protein
MHQGKESKQIEAIIFRIDTESPKPLARADPASHSDSAIVQTKYV